MDNIIDSFDDLTHANYVVLQMNSIIKKGNFEVKKMEDRWMLKI